MALPMIAALAVAPATAHATIPTNLATGGVTASGSALTIGVSGASGTDGAIQAGFTNASEPLFWGVDTTSMNDQTAAYFSLNTPSGLYSPQPYTMDNQPFTQLSAPVKTGTGTAGDPFVITSRFRATADLDITQTVTHVSGTTRLTAAWAIHNSAGSSVNMQVFEGADLYVNGNDNGTGTSSGSQPNRMIGSVASDGSVAYLVEQASKPWSHFYSGMNSQFYETSSDSSYGYLSDTIDPTLQDSGMAVEWDDTLAAGATKTYTVQWYFTAPPAPAAPVITSGAPAEGTTVQARTATPAFTYAPGNANLSVAYECQLDSGAWSACNNSRSLTGLADGSHTFSVRALNSAGVAGPATTRTWTVDGTAPGAPTIGSKPAVSTSANTANFTFTGEAGATFRCSFDGSPFTTCSSPINLAGLTDGSHTFAVKQTDAAGNAGTLADSYTWVIDSAVPAAPGNVSTPADSESTNATVTFTPANGTTAECSLDNGTWTACSSPVNVTGLAVGAHSLKIRQISGTGVVGTVATTSWTVKAPPAPPTTGTGGEDTPATPPTPTDDAPVVDDTPPAKPTWCISRRTIDITFKVPARIKATAIEVLVEGKRVNRLKKTARAAKISLVGMKGPGTVKVKINAVVGKKTVLLDTRTYKTCTPAGGDD
ncbi:hypothetical protein OJ997_01025 [Solirubrobacter phytolaccae]|uniref:Ig-like domain-containing protein n=1 Tax=Solirubrobacter phytolaccae TaxID=1404360 RepID=A0A9X3N3E7_9ACTN|nr:hypothetical protein [Solirubrobacter phytolaccae]MDA0178859.1 hypothetical protein [Solirubrobacter phytolaccae]